MKNNKKLNRKHYIGNALTNAFFPVLASLGITLGAVATTVTLQTRTSSGETGRNHTIEIDTTPQPGHDGWNLSVFNEEGEQIKKAKKDDVVVFYVSKDEYVKSNTLEQDPTHVLINNHMFELEYVGPQQLKATVTIPFVENMTAKLYFPRYDNECLVSFYDNDPLGAERLLTQIKTPKNQTLESLPDAPELAGYTFKGWYDEKTGGNEIKAGEGGTIIETDMSIYAQWNEAPAPTIRTLTIKDQTSEGWTLTATDQQGRTVTTIEKGMKVNFTVKPSNTINSDIPTKVILTATPSADQSSFNLIKQSDGSYKANDIEIPYDSNIEAEYLIEDVKPEQRWVVAFNVNGGTKVDSQKVWDGETIDQSEEKAVTTKTGYAFGGWYLNSECTGDAFDLSSPITSDITLHAKWNINEYSVKYYLDWDETYKEPRGPLYEEVLAKHGTIPYPQSGNPTKTQEGHTFTFLGWQQVIDGELQEVGIHEATAHTIYIAKWQDTINQYTIVFDSMGGQPEISSETVDYNTIITAPEVTKLGHKNPVWYDEQDKVFDFTKGVKKSQKLHAVWTAETYTCTFVNTNGETVVGDVVNADYNTIPSPTATPSLPSVTEEGHEYTFKGWKQIEPTISEDIGLKPMPANNAKYIAVFEDTPPTRLALKLVVNFGSVTIESYSIDAGAKIPKSLEPIPSELEAAGKSFAGWYEDEECAMKPFGDSPVTHDMTLYAKIVPKYDTDTSKFTTVLNEDDGLTITGYTTTKTSAFSMSIPDKLPYTDPSTQEVIQKPVTKITGFLPSGKKTLLTSLNIPDTVNEIGAGVFTGYTALTNINIENVVKIGDTAFKDCTALTEIRLSYKNEWFGTTTSNDVTDYWNYGAFYNCTGLKKISYVDTPDTENTPKLTLGVGCFGNSGKNVLQCLAFPKTLKTICKEAFYLYPNSYLSAISFEGTDEQWNSILTSFGTKWYGTPRTDEFKNSYLRNVKCGNGVMISISRT